MCFFFGGPAIHQPSKSQPTTNDDEKYAQLPIDRTASALLVQVKQIEGY